MLMILHLLYQLKYDMNQIQSWLSANKRTLNVKKKSVLIGSYYKLSHVDKNFSVKVKNTPTSISGSSHRWIFKVAVGTPMKVITKKISEGLAVLKRTHPTAPSKPLDTRISMYNAFQWCLTSIIVVRSGEILVSWNLDRNYLWTNKLDAQSQPFGKSTKDQSRMSLVLL